ncbi:MAG: amino acid adenylation domain-containing protein [Acidobacteriota bacterium]
MLAGIWSDLLGLGRVGGNDHFFELGGHSLLATQVMSRVRSALGVELPLRDLFESPTLSGFAARVETAQWADHESVVPPLVAVPRDGRECALPLSFAQQRLWFLDQLEPGSALYNIAAALRVEGPLEPRLLALALGEIVCRHETLRTVFSAAEGPPVQRIRSVQPFSLPVLDLAGLPEVEREAEALALCGVEAGRPFDLSRDPLLRSLLLRLAPLDHLVALTVHHIASDGWSMGILVREVTALYGAFAAGSGKQRSLLPELPIRYADYAGWQRSWLVGEVLEEEISYWRKQLAGLPPLLELPTDRPRPPVQSYRGAARPVRLSADLASSLAGIGRREGATPYMLLLAGFQALLARYSGQEDVAVGSPVAGRNRLETEGLIGFFVNTLVLRGDLSGEPTYHQLVSRVRETSLAAHLHQDLPFEKLVQELSPERSLAQSPLFQVMFVLQNAPVANLSIRDLRLRSVGRAGTTAKFDLTLSLGEDGQGGYGGTIEYATDLFDPATLERWFGHFERLLAAAVAAPDSPVFSLPVLSAAELAQVLGEWNDTRVEGFAEGLLHEGVFAQAARTPFAVAIELGEERWSYRRLAGSARELASYLRHLGVGPEVIVGLCVERSPAMVVGMLAILEAGGAYLPLDPTYPRERLDFMLDDSGARILLVQDSLLGRVPTQGRLIVPLDARWDSDRETFDRLPGAMTPDQLAYVIYTSGSTGRPKGVMVAHRGVCNRLRWAQAVYRLDERDAVLQKASFGFDFSVWECFAPLRVGARLVLAEPGRQGDGRYLARVLREHRVSVVHFVPSLLAAFLAEEEGGESVAGSLRQVFAGGEALTPEVRDRALARFSVPLDNQYGPTEISIDTTRWVCAPGQDPHRVSIGRPIANSRLYVADAELRPLPIGVAGELLIGGSGVTRGYLRRPHLTASRFVPDPLGGDFGGRLYRTGDLARWLPDGTLDFLGRIDHQVKIRGFRIELGEVEAALSAQPGVREAVVVARAAPAGDPRLIGYVVGDATAAALREALRERLPDHMIPAAFVSLPALPLTSSGKLDRQALTAPEWRRPEDLYQAPRTPVEEILAGIWSDLLGLDRVGANDHFFELGGHSLLATQVMSRVRSAFGFDLPLRDLFESPTLSGLAARVETAQRMGYCSVVPPLVAVPRDGRERALPLSFAQQRLWFIDQLEPGSPLYNIPAALRIEGPLDRRLLALSLDEIVRRHETLRTVFSATEGAPIQVIHPAQPFALTEQDLSSLPEAECEAAALALCGVEAGRPFDLSRGPLLRALLLRLAPHDHVVALTIHHIASDGWSMGILVREVAALYAAFAAGPGEQLSLLPELPIQYADYAVWQRSWLIGEVLKGEISYWREQLAGLPPLLELPADRPRPSVRSYRGAVRPVRLSGEVASSLAGLGRREGATLFMALLAGFQVLLARYSGQEDVAVGSPVAGRNRLETEGLIGFFVNTLVLRGDLSGEPTYRELMSRIRDVSLSGHLHQEVPFEKLVQELSPERSLAQSPLFQVMFALQNAPVSNLEVRDLRLRPMGSSGTTAKFDLTLSLTEGSGGLSGGIEYARDLFDPATIDRLTGHFGRLIASAVATPDRNVLELPWLDRPESHQLLSEWGWATERHSEAEALHRGFEAQVLRAAEAPALTSGDASLSYGDLNRRANQLAHWLRGQGVGHESRVGLCLERSPMQVIGILAVLKAGGAYVPLDPSYPKERLAYMIEDSGVEIVIGDAASVGALPAAGLRIVLDAQSELLDALPGHDLEPLADGASLAYVIYTSGSTGRPKGTLVSHGNVRRLFDATKGWFGFGERDVWTLFHSTSFDFSVWEIWGALLHGGRLVIVPFEVSRSPESFLDLLIRERVTVLNQTPSSFAQVARADAERGGAATDLRLVIFGGEALDPASLAPWFARHGDERPLLVNMYGITETTVHVTFRPLRVADACRERRSVIGVPIPDLSLAVMDRHLRQVPIGVAGELVIGGAGLARGYLGRPDLTAQRFVPDAASGDFGARLYRSGDLGRFLADGDVEYLGRIDSQVKVRGFRIELGEIEATLAGLPGVREAVVVARQDGRSDRRLVAYVVGEAKVETLRAALLARLPEYMVPAAFVALARLPLTINGKLDRQALPAPERQRSEEGYQAPRTPVEEILAGIWAELLGLERPGAADHFFELGGHSLLATQVMSRLRSALGVELPLRDLFESPTLSGLAARVETALRSRPGAVAPPLVPLPRGASMPLSFAQQRLWFLDRLEPGTPLYNIPAALRIEGPLEPRLLALCLSEIVRRHETLRTVFVASEGAPTQVIEPAAAFALPALDLSGLAEAEREAAALALIGQEASRPFDLSVGPLLRAAVLRLAAGDHVVALNLHHIASDGWSMGILVREIAALYAAFAEGRPSPLPELPVQYADFSAWQRAWLDGDALAGEISYWRHQLAGLPPLLELPTDRPRPAVQSSRGASRPVRLSADLFRRLEALGQREGATPYMVLLAGFQVLLARYSGRRDFAVGTPVAGRNRLETEGLIGFFVNTLVLRGDLSGEPSFLDLIGRVRETSLAAHLHQDVPFEKLVQELAPERSLAQAPLFQVMFALQNAPAASLEVESLRFRPMGGVDRTAKFDLTLSLGESGGSLGGTVEYVTNLFDPATIERLIEHLDRLLWAAVAAADAPVFSLAFLSAAERGQILWEWNDTGAPQQGGDLYRDVLEQAQRAPDAIALEFGDRSFTYARLIERASTQARHLGDERVGPGDLVALAAEREPELIVAMVSVLQSGAAYLPLDSTYPKERLDQILSDSGALLPAWLTEVEPGGGSAQSSLGDADGAGSRIEPEGAAYVIYTSGSSGQPKGVVVPQRAITAFVRAARAGYQLSPRDRVLQFAAIGFDTSVEEIWMTLTSGAALVLRTADMIDSIPRFLREVERLGITVLDLPTAFWHELVAGMEAEDLQVPPGLRLVIVGGEEALADPLAVWRRRAGASVRLVNSYGPTEATVVASASELTHLSVAGPVPIGRPVTGARTHVLDDLLEPVPIGVRGELWIGGAGVALGYLRRPALTAERFLPDPFSSEPGARLYRTGDLAYLRPEGELVFAGRADRQVKIRGFRVELGEVESVLVGLPGVRQAVVVVRVDEPGDRRLIAYVVGEASDDLLRQALRERLPAYMVPAAWVVLETLPLTASGKVDRQRLPVPGDAPSRKASARPPREPLELALVLIWEELLGVRPIGVTDSFFDLGGHSLLAVGLMARIRRRLGLELPLSTLFEHPTIEHLAERLRRRPERPVPSSLVSFRPGDETPAEPPLIFVHPVGGQVFSYLELARHLGSDLPFQALQAMPQTMPQTTADEPPSIESLAATYLEQITAIWPSGPYRLGGWSMGGVVAYEMACRLAQRGQTVDFLALVDAAIPVARKAGATEVDGRGEGPSDEQRARFEFCRDLMGVFGGDLDLASAELLALSPDQALHRILAEARRAGALPAGFEVEDVLEHLEIFKANRLALERYRPASYGGAVTLFRCEDGAGPRKADLGWGRLAQRLEVVGIPGDHYSAIRVPRVEGFARTLKARAAKVPGSS